MTSQVSIAGTRRVVALVALLVGTIAVGQAEAGGIMAYEVGTADVGLAAAGYSARAQDASTVFTNSAGMTRLEGTQLLASGQVLWGSTQFTVEPGTSPGLGTGDGGHAVGSDGWFLGGGMFLSHTASPKVKLGFGLTGNFGAPLKYDDDWVGRYYVQEGTILGISLLPALAYKASDKLSLGASATAMLGDYKNKVAINNADPSYGDGQLSLEDTDWGWGGNVGLLYEVKEGTRYGLTWNSEVALDFSSPAEFTDLSPSVSTALDNAGLLNSTIDVGIKVPQQVMGSVFTQVKDGLAMLGSVGWQDWSQFGQLQLGVEDTANPTSTTAELPLQDTWHFALGAQHRASEKWTLNFGIAYDTGFQDSSTVSPLMPVNSAWRFGFGGELQKSKTSRMGFALEYLYGGTLTTDLKSTAPVALGGRGDIVGPYNSTSTIFFGFYGNWQF